ncbi:MAG: hypothetical protein K2Y39_14130 [Candidatus Obscuribacterales bacterium]|nr:hypothetical protein [Candidatus Obscuribacterales bacterium]
MDEKKDDRSISIGNNSVIGSIQTGDKSFAHVQQPIQFPPADSVDLVQQLTLLRECIDRLNLADKIAVDENLAELQVQVEGKEPDKGKVGNALTKIAGYLKKSSVDLATKETLKHCFMQFAGWLGSNWHHLVNHFSH